MTSEPIIVLSEVNSRNLPITAHELEKLISDGYQDNHLDTKGLAKHVVTSLAQKSSRFKYIVTINRIEANESSKNNIASSLSTSWDEKNDGLLTIKVSCTNGVFLIVTALFISSF